MKDIGKIIIIIILLYILFFTLHNFDNNNINNNLNLEIIISRYNEDLEWTIQEPFNKYKYIVYNKGKNDKFNKTNVKKIIPVENIGRCDHTYLYHIIKNYNQLGDIVVFLPGSLNMEFKIPIGKSLFYNIENNSKAVFLGHYKNNIKKAFYDFKIEEWKASFGANVEVNNESKLLLSENRPFGKWYTKHFGNKDANYYCYYGIFSIDKRDIIQYPLSYYQTLIKDLETHSNPEAGHYFERAWGVIFAPMKYTIYKNENIFTRIFNYIYFNLT
jgi:hypothetical protein